MRFSYFIVTQWPFRTLPQPSIKQERKIGKIAPRTREEVEANILPTYGGFINRTNPFFLYARACVSIYRQMRRSTPWVNGVDKLLG